MNFCTLFPFFQNCIFLAKKLDTFGKMLYNESYKNTKESNYGLQRVQKVNCKEQQLL